MKFEFSAGGIVFHKRGNIVEILLCQHSQHHGWVFPKGLIGDHVQGEGKRETALREVEEETGVKGEIIKELTPIFYWYVWGKEKRKKTVYYYIMRFLSGDITKHDNEMENVAFFSLDEVSSTLTYPSDKKVWQEAKKIIEKM